MTEAADADVSLITATEAAQRVAGGALLIDVRSEPSRIRFGTVPGAEAVAKDAVQERFSSQVRDEADREIVVFCGSEAGSGPVVGQLRDLGYTTVTHIAGGFAHWQADGLPTEPGQDEG